VSGGQIAALIFAVLLLLPGGCLVVSGLADAIDRSAYSLVELAIAAAILGLAGFLFWVAVRRRPLIFALLLLLPGGCFLVAGIVFSTHDWDVSLVMLPVAAAILSLAGLLFWVALRRRSAPSVPPDVPLP
jgi:peptidoglycan/LPS O-acetylase OafA/YrhL